jgi:hypothetical protein
MAGRTGELVGDDFDDDFEQACERKTQIELCAVEHLHWCDLQSQMSWQRQCHGTGSRWRTFVSRIFTPPHTARRRS